MGRPPLPIGTWGDISATHEGDGMWRASARYRGRDGRTRVYSRRRRGGRQGSAAKAALREALGRMQVGDRTGELTPDARVSDLLDYWMTTWKAAAPRRANTLKTNEKALGIAKKRVGGLRISEATTGALEAAVNGVRDSSGIETGRQVRSALTRAFADAVRLDLIGANPAAGISSRAADRGEVRALTATEVAALRSAARTWEREGGQGGNRPWGERRIAASIDVMLGTGVRIGELLALRRSEDVDLSADPPTLEVSGTLIMDGGTVRQPMPKSTTSERTSYLPAFAAGAIRAHIEETDGGEVGALFPSPSGRWWELGNYRRSFREVRSLAGLPWVTPHSLRRTVATTLGVKLGSTQLGHASAAVTAQRYVERMTVGPVEVVDMMDALVKSQE